MDNNSMNRHITQNTARRERERQGRLGMDISTVNELVERENMRAGEHRTPNCNDNDMRYPNDRNGRKPKVEMYNIEKLAYRNNAFRTILWTGGHLQTTLMSIGRGDEIGTELHEDTDQYIRIEHGCAVALVGERADCLKERGRMYEGDVIFIPAGTWHNIVNAGRGTLKLSSTYAPPHHKA
ncbi:MAG: cupin domain-containing protein [Eubacteriales bacterium]